ncbi:MAG: LysR family transcriptional regulator [Sphingomonadales bacterium]|nr:LysR family transcriptional regulator [Sphingomonadales bacterium]
MPQASNSLWLISCLSAVRPNHAVQRTSELSRKQSVRCAKQSVLNCLAIAELGDFLMPIIADFIDAYPAIVLDLNFSDKVVDVIEEGYDVVVRTGAANDSGLMRRRFGRFTGRLVALPAYLARRGTPCSPAELIDHACLRQRSPATGKLHEWALREVPVGLPEAMSASTIAPLIELAVHGTGIAFLPPFTVAGRVADGSLVHILTKYIFESGELAAMWPTSRQLSRRIRVFVDLMADRLDFAES